MADDKKDQPDATSSDYDAQVAYWNTVSAILGGAPAMRKPAQGPVMSVAGPAVPYAQLRQLKSRLGATISQSPFLPAFESESVESYGRRLAHSPLTNIYSEISENLSSKPFAKECQLEEGAAPNLEELAEDIDGQGNTMHVFASTVFKKGIDYGVHWIIVDYTQVSANATLADERAAGARPYWVSVDATRVLAAYSVFLGSKEHLYHLRIAEDVVEQDGYAEVCRKRVRIFKRDVERDPRGKALSVGAPYFEVWQEEKSGDKSYWELIDGGSLVNMSQIPAVAFHAGQREGTTWKFCPPLRDVGLLQVEEFQQESGLKHIKELTAFPMLAGNGVKKPADAEGQEVVVPVGPGAVLFAPPDNAGNHGEWAWIAPPAECLTFLQQDLEKLRTEMRHLGKQPMATANLTVVTTANVSMRASSAVQAWAILLRDALEVAWHLTCEWLNQEPSPSVSVYTDFSIELEAGKELTEIRELEKQGILSKEDTAAEFKRRGVLRDDFDWEENQERRAGDEEGLAPEEPIDPATGQPVGQEVGFNGRGRVPTPSMPSRRVGS